MYSNKKTEQVAQVYFEIWTIKVGIGVKNNSSVDFETFLFIPWYVFYHLHVVHFQTFSHKKLCFFCSLLYPKLIGIGNLKVWFLKITLPKKPLQSYTQIVIFQKVGVWNWFWYQIKAGSVFLTMIPKSHFTQNVTCSTVLWECITFSIRNFRDV